MEKFTEIESHPLTDMTNQRHSLPRCDFEDRKTKQNNDYANGFFPEGHMPSEFNIESAPPVDGFRFIKNTGDCDDHGYFLPKQKVVAMKSVSNAGVEFVDVSQSELCAALVYLSQQQNARLKNLSL